MAAGWHPASRDEHAKVTHGTASPTSAHFGGKLRGGRYSGWESSVASTGRQDLE